jgi:hypothetical protein
MAQFQRNRGDVLDAEERAKSARKCLRLLMEPRISKDKWSENDYRKFDREMGFSNSVIYAPSDQTLQWLRDMVSRYVT